MNTKNGSALLIVLGFLSFMVVSAVAFSIYMRSERLPSSAFRRQVATRHLVKAALNYAMTQVDQAICDDPYPGLVRENKSRHLAGKDVQRYTDMWLGNVYMPPEPHSDSCASDGMMDGEGKDENGVDGGRLVPSSRLDETVPVLNLEALGYLPPALVNDVRFLSRVSWSAKWHYFDYDAGRCAYTAVNVSDCIDINHADFSQARTSMHPVSPVSFFAPEGSSDGSSQVAPFANTLESKLNDYPLVSMLDYNLLMGSQYSAFYNYIGGNDNSFNHGDDDKFGKYYFIAGAPQSAVHTNFYALANLANRSETKDAWGQPFGWSVSMDGLANNGNAHSLMLEDAPVISQYFRPMLTFPDLLSLYDYLDCDDIPSSLAFPTTERVPMIVGVQPQFDIKFTIKKEESTESIDDLQQYKITKYLFDGNLFGGSKIFKVLSIFPFKRGIDPTACKVQVVARIFLSTGDGVRMTKATMNDTVLRLKKTDWQNGERITMDDHSFTIVSSQEPLNAEPVLKEIDTLEITDISIGANFDDTSLYSKYPLLIVKQKQTRETVDSAWKDDGDPECSTDFHPIDPDSGKLLLETLKDDNNEKYIPSMAVWVRVIQGSDTVDFVPATLEDDTEFNNIDTSISRDFGYSGDGVPLLRFPDEKSLEFVFNQKDIVKVDGAESEWNKNSFQAVDPRFNYAPEDWMFDSQDLSKSKWLDNVHSFQEDHAGCDPDIFMFVSNQGYLQSMGELAFLPNMRHSSGALPAIVSDTGSPKLSTQMPEADIADYNGGHDGKRRTKMADIANANLAWHTYHSYKTDGQAHDNLYKKGISEGKEAFRINPYTANPAVFRTAIANTPYDFWSSAEIIEPDYNLDSTKKEMHKTIAESYKYAFNESRSGQDARISFEHMTNIAEYVRNEIRMASVSTPWYDTLDNLNWFEDGDYEGDKKLFGCNLDDPLHSVDRKFLHAFWRNCFSDQQLFLIFVRAESTSASGASGGKGAQLGGRAVALVSRDAATPENKQVGSRDEVDVSGRMTWNRIPHKMRVLFYHQFD